ncbi:hypothetical protein Pmani_015376 [Petrolisthes manimaculis]|uniref:Uncharacterized protein n=1 Tax=Petrolisthes manimaculis TaxID=1843537 RepID=A0AAE1PR12_9EUCA|nr:hypothetical protein Pmani_015376 [Petrolisthes manimaculis]
MGAEPGKDKGPSRAAYHDRMGSTSPKTSHHQNLVSSMPKILQEGIGPHNPPPQQQPVTKPSPAALPPVMSTLDATILLQQLEALSSKYWLQSPPTLQDHSLAPPPCQLPPPQWVLPPPPHLQPLQDPRICSYYQRLEFQARNCHPPCHWAASTGPGST